MAFLSSGNQGDLISGGGGYAGAGATIGGKQKTTAGKPGGWYNIQDFLAANPQTPNVQSRMTQRGSQQLGEAKGQLQSQVSALPSMPTPEQYSQERFGGILQDGVTGGEASNLRSFLDQSYTPSATPQELLPGVQSPYKNMQPGSFESVMNWYGDIERPSAAYTPGMQKMDEMLLRGQKGFAQEFPTQLQQQFQSEVGQPLEAKRTEVGQQQEATKQQFSDEGKQWYEGIGGFLSGEKQKLTDTYEKQRAELAKQSAMTPQQIMGQDYWSAAQQYQPYEMMPGLNKPSLGMPEYQLQHVAGIDPMNFLNRAEYTTPSMDTAANVLYSPEQLNTYNVLSGLLPEEQYGSYTGSEVFKPGEWSFDAPGFMNDYKRVERQVAEAKARDRINQILGMPSAQLPYGQTAEQAGLASYNVPGQIATRYGNTYLTLPQAGTTVWQPYTNLPQIRPSILYGSGGDGGGRDGGGSSGGGVGSGGGSAGDAGGAGVGV